MNLDIGFTGAFLAGLISFISPCVLPLVPPYLSFLAGVSLDQFSDDERPVDVTRRVVLTAAVFVLGFSTVFVALGASASLIGSFVTEHLTVLGYIAGAIILLLGLHFLGVFRIGLLYREARFQGPSKPLGLAGAYVIGLAFAFGWTPCVGPVLAAILLYAGSEADVARGAALLFAYSLGIGLPFIIAAFFAGPFMRLMQRFRQHMGTVEKTMGFMLVITGILFLTNSMSTIAFFMLDLFPSLGTFG
ncbi:MAG: cytochrome c biogenesis protein CcdA [Ahrensia sp.]|nr:cytochrome c biogenesis protein CcdA [Ahrensia sp.]